MRKMAVILFTSLAFIKPVFAEGWLCLAQDRTFSYEGENDEKSTARRESLSACLKHSPQPEKCAQARCVASTVSRESLKAMSWEQRELVRQQIMKKDWERQSRNPQTPVP